MESNTQEPGEWPALQKALAELESAASDAIVPGDLRPWCDALLPSLEKAALHWRGYAHGERGTRAQIEADDPALAPRTEALGGAAEAIGGALEDLVTRIHSLQVGDAIEADGSAEPVDSLERLRRDALAWIVSARAHHAEIGTWLHEASNRDRGVVD